MFSGIPQPTPLDLCWRMFGVDVRVHPFFWLFSAVLGWSWIARSPLGISAIILWVACVFVSVLLHELGHVFMGRVFGSNGHILLFSFGGLAIGANNLRQRWQRILVLFAGPGAQFVVLAIVFGLMIALVPASNLAGDKRGLVVAETLLSMLFWINLVWPLLNLLPIFPLDGGQICRETLEGFLGRRGIIISLGISIGVAAVLAVQMMWPIIPFLPGGGQLYMTIFFALMAVSNIQMLQQELNRGWPRDNNRMPWE